MKKFIILTKQRTGSTLLCTSMDMHPHIRCHGEVLLRKAHSADSYWKFHQGGLTSKLAHSLCSSSKGDKIPASMQRKVLYPYLDNLYSDQALSRPWKSISEWDQPYHEEGVIDHAVGFKLMDRQLHVNHSISAYVREKGIHCIHLYRGNLFDNFLSGKTMKMSGVTHAQDQDITPKMMQLEVNVDEFKNFVIQSKQAHQARSEWMKSHAPSYVEISYEDLNNQFQETMTQVSDFLEVERYEFEPRLRKLNKGGYAERVSNWDKIQPEIEAMDIMLKATI